MEQRSVDLDSPATLRGFDCMVRDLETGGLHLRHPLITFGDDDTPYLPGNLDWKDRPDRLHKEWWHEAEELGTVLPRMHQRRIAPGQGVIVAGEKYERQARKVDATLLEDLRRTKDQRTRTFWMLVATVDEYRELKQRIVDAAKEAFDAMLLLAMKENRRLCPRGNAALKLMVGDLFNPGVGYRMLAGSRQNREWRVHRRQRDGYDIFLKDSKREFHKGARRYWSDMWHNRRR